MRISLHFMGHLVAMVNSRGFSVVLNHLKSFNYRSF